MLDTMPIPEIVVPRTLKGQEGKVMDYLRSLTSPELEKNFFMTGPPRDVPKWKEQLGYLIFKIDMWNVMVRSLEDICHQKPLIQEHKQDGLLPKKEITLQTIHEDLQKLISVEENNAGFLYDMYNESRRQGTTSEDDR